MEWRDGLGEALQDERPDQSTSNGPISDFVASFITDAAVGDTREATLPHKATIVVSLFCSAYRNVTANDPTQNSFSCFVFCHYIEHRDFLVEEIRILMAPH